MSLIKIYFVAHRTSLTPPLLLKYLFQAKKKKRCHVLCVRGVDFESFYNFDIAFYNCSDSMVFLFLFFIIFATINNDNQQ